MAACCGGLQIGDRYFKSFVAMRARANRLPGRRRRGELRPCTGRFELVGLVGLEWQGRLQFSGRTAPAAGSIILKPAGNFTPPFGLDGQIPFGRSGNSARNRRPSKAAQGGVTETT